MKNLKKALVLVLAFAMIFGMFTIGASAASFSDDEDIVNKEAVETMVQLGIINGNPDGTFAPNRVVTRAEMCKMICIALNGGTEPLLDSGTAVFSDTAGHWASKYINYCYSMGIVSGDSGKGGPFRPDATVTALEAAKMMLVALGYNASAASFVGADWAQNVAREANRKGLFDGIGALNAYAGLTRDNAAQLISNGINAELVEYENTLGMEDGKLITIPKIKDLSGKSIISEKYKAIKVEGVVTKNEFNTGSSYKGKTEIVVTNTEGINQFGPVSGGARVSGPVDFKVETGANEIGKTVTLYVRPSVSTPNTGTQATVIGKATVSSVNKIYTTGKALVDDSTKTNDLTKTLDNAGLKFADNNPVTTYVNYVVDTTNFHTGNSAETNISDWENNDGVEAQYIDNNGDGKIDVVTYVKYSFGKVSRVSVRDKGTLYVTNKGSEVVSFASDDAKKEVPGFENLGLTTDDYVTFIKVAGKYYVEKSVPTTVTVKSTKSTNTVTTADGVTYKPSSLAGAAFDEDSSSTLVAAVTINKTAAFHLDKFGFVIFVTDADASSTTRYLMLSQVAISGDFNDSVVAKAVFDDGTTATITIAKYDRWIGGTSAPKTIGSSDTATTSTAATAKSELDATKIDTTTPANSVIYKYTVDSNGKYTITAEDTTDAQPTAIKRNTPDVDSGNIIANNSTTIVLKNLTGSAYTKYDGIDEVVTREKATGADLYVWAVVDNGVAKIIFAQGGTGETSTADNIIYVLDKTPVVTKDANNKDEYNYTVIRKGEVVTIKGATNNLFAAAGIYTVTFVDGVIQDSPAPVAGTGDLAAADVTIASKGVISNGNTVFSYNDSTRFLLVKGTAVTETTVDEIITDTGNEDDIAIIAGTGSETYIAKYVFIVR